MKQNQWIAVAAGLALVVFFLYGNAIINIFKSNTSNMQSSSGVVVQDVLVGTGATAATGDTVTVHYVGTFQDGKVFDSSRDGGQPFSFVLGSGNVIKGWDEGLVGMKVGGKRHLVISPDYAYGASGYGPIPPNSTLVFEVELLNVAKP